MCMCICTHACIPAESQYYDGLKKFNYYSMYFIFRNTLS